MLNDDPHDAREVAHIKQRIGAEIDAFDPKRAAAGIEDWNVATLADFKNALIEPNLMELNLPGGITDYAYAVTRKKGPYRVMWLPWNDIFSLAVESRFGPVDISVHGDAIGCFSSV
ncbi:hypothetical protein [Maritimibacter sp. UBA3975]|uniref:hypothetical protein n=1 Tax=Maritimibacter sp. UBA3975 TaxID=1946833 RepID=UPI000C0B3BE5|nr:hypothetical protein [Maritimibacter sp. UBA3975]MAM63273.1 hypothetical protein [Maritimibacter sp.]|tara:strand:- start:69555 stop:69902 length:348 start_codon:yes stop_codon:yes gene_type:complete